MSHLFTQWGAKHAPKIMATVNGEYKRIFGWETKASGKEYKAFLTQFAKALISFIDEKGIRGRCVFHTSDEPGRNHYRPYKKAARLIHSLFNGFKTIDALSDFKFYKKGLVKTPVPANDHMGPFIGNVPELWTYYCCVQRNNYVSNRFLAMPSQRNRIIGWQMYKYDVKGFLHWGYNFWFTQFAKRAVNPFEETDAGGKFSSGDSFVVYPGEDKQPIVSLALKVFYDAVQDMTALQLLESKIGRDNVIGIIENNTKKPISFTEYPHEEGWMLNKREEINKELQKIIAVQHYS